MVVRRTPTPARPLRRSQRLRDKDLALARARLSALLRKHLHRLPFNLTDPLTCEPLRAGRTVHLQLGERYKNYDCASLAEALLRTGEPFLEPFARVPLRAPELLRIDHQCARAGHVAPSLFLEHRSPALTQLSRERSSLLAAFDRIVEELADKIKARSLSQDVQELSETLVLLSTMDMDAALDVLDRLRTALPSASARIEAYFYAAD